MAVNLCWMTQQMWEVSTVAGVGGTSYMFLSVLINVWSLGCSLYSRPCITYLRKPLCSSLQWFADVNSTTLIKIQRQMRSNLTNTFQNQLPLNTIFTKRCKILQWTPNYLFCGLTKFLDFLRNLKRSFNDLGVAHDISFSDKSHLKRQKMSSCLKDCFQVIT